MSQQTSTQCNMDVALHTRCITSRHCWSHPLPIRVYKVLVLVYHLIARLRIYVQCQAGQSHYRFNPFKFTYPSPQSDLPPLKEVYFGKLLQSEEVQKCRRARVPKSSLHILAESEWVQCSGWPDCAQTTKQFHYKKVNLVVVPP